ncbi:Protein N-acetyltransferase, RimJ/RimL family [Halomicrobium zhouii]|uniref:Protein N-acetyltransferase, RimJ/RimL family n=1 Tax=Halomicrobium zhouii TaxID=767519 RepID=A0A1I6LBE8_9EURY|nr:GNAT family protein [Halomicrobium zhouii]SFS00767.1 Protein N-acetyltransferase, RimJ/RimL family [Halomicrobium zhouii]
MSGPTFLRGETVTLRVVDEDDLAFAQRVVNHPEVRRGVGAFAPKTAEDEREWYERQDDDGPSFVLYASDQPVGIAGLHLDPYPWGYAEVGYMVHPDHWGHGYATDAVRCLVRYAFDERRLHKVGADVYAPNEASQRVLEKVGFEREGVRRDHAFVDGDHVDLYEYGLLESEWRE